MLVMPDTAVVKDWLGHALEAGAARGLTRTGLAQHCGVTRQAVNGWISTGRIAKGHLSNAVAYLGSAPNFMAPTASPRKAAQVEQLPGRYSLEWPFQTIDAAAVRRLDQDTLHRLETILLTVAAQLGIDLSKRAAA